MPSLILNLFLMAYANRSRALFRVPGWLFSPYTDKITGRSIHANCRKPSTNTAPAPSPSI